MRTLNLLSLALVSLAINACGVGSAGSPNGGGNLQARAVWERTAQRSFARSITVMQGQAFGTTLPDSVQSVAIKFQSAAEVEPHCLAVDPRNLGDDRKVVLHNLPAGPGEVTILGFASDTAVADEVCRGLRSDTLSFLSEPQPVVIEAGTETDAGDIPVFALPFPVVFAPLPDTSTVSPVSISLSVAVARVDGVTGIDRESLVIDVTENGEPVAVPFVISPCDDRTESPCSPGGTLDSTGFLITSAVLVPLADGTATVRVRAATAGTSVRELDSSYQFTVQAAPFGRISGNVVDCLNNSPIAGAEIHPVDPEAAAVLSASDGSFAIDEFPFGSFAIEAQADGYIDSRISGTVLPQRPNEEITVALCPLGGPNGMRVVLTWGAGPPAPADLDSHLRGPVPSTGALTPAEFHVDFTNTNIIFSSGGAATLDIDSTEFAGPETETVDTLIPGVYRFCVHDFSDRDQPGASGFSNSSANVRLFIGDEQRGEFLAPNAPGNLWAVFEVDTRGQDPVVTAINSVSDESDRRLVCHRADDADGDGLTGEQEAAAGTDPNDYDTNENGISDGQDIINGDSPLPQP